jgi:hypothetical protein
VQEADHQQEIEKTEEEGRKLLVDLVKLAKIAISPVLGNGVAEFEEVFTNQSLIFSEINGVAGFLLLSAWAGPRGSGAIRRRNSQNLYVIFPDTYAVFLPGGEVSRRKAPAS